MKAFCSALIIVVQLLLCSWSMAQDEIGEFRELDRYEQQLNAVLQTRLDEEKEFVAAVMELVKDGELPQTVVDNAFVWVRTHRGLSHRGFVYFERVLRLQADKLKIEIPEFDYQVYSSTGGRR